MLRNHIYYIFHNDRTCPLNDDKSVQSNQWRSIVYLTENPFWEKKNLNLTRVRLSGGIVEYWTFVSYYFGINFWQFLVHVEL